MKIINNITRYPQNINDISYVIPLFKGSYIYLIGNLKVLRTSNFNTFQPSDINSTDLINIIQATIPLYNNPNMITYVLFNDKFNYFKIRVGSSSSTTSRISISTLKKMVMYVFIK